MIAEAPDFMPEEVKDYHRVSGTHLQSAKGRTITQELFGNF